MDVIRGDYIMVNTCTADFVTLAILFMGFYLPSPVEDYVRYLGELSLNAIAWELLWFLNQKWRG